MRTPARFLLAGLLAGTVLLVAPVQAVEQTTTVYRSVDKSGNAVYSQFPIAGAESRRVTTARSSDMGEEIAAPKTEFAAACTKARENLELITGGLTAGKYIEQDRDGDGKAERLTPDEVIAEKDMAERQVAAYCTNNGSSSGT